jgi:uncharacterized membrane protein YphA (DoxX/SURF4 family)
VQVGEYRLTHFAATRRKEPPMKIFARHLPSRVSTGGFILHSGLQKLHGTEEQAQAIHGMAAGAYPFLADVEPAKFLRALAVAEVGIGTALLTPFVPNRLAGAALTAFAGALVTLYLRTPMLHEPGSIWPTQDGIAVSKDVWMLGIGLGLLAERPEPAR